MMFIHHILEHFNSDSVKYSRCLITFYFTMRSYYYSFMNNLISKECKLKILMNFLEYCQVAESNFILMINYSQIYLNCNGKSISALEFSFLWEISIIRAQDYLRKTVFTTIIHHSLFPISPTFLQVSLFLFALNFNAQILLLQTYALHHSYELKILLNKNIS